MNIQSNNLACKFSLLLAAFRQGSPEFFAICILSSRNIEGRFAIGMDILRGLTRRFRALWAAGCVGELERP
jgi:hypothetical protein